MDRWQNQEEAYQFAMKHDACMLDMEMGTGKTRVAIDVALSRPDVVNVLVVCPKAVVPVWRTNLEKFHKGRAWSCWDTMKGSARGKTDAIDKFLSTDAVWSKFVVVNYEMVWRGALGEYLHHRAHIDMVILDESHRAKAAGSKVSKYLAMLGRKIKYKMCLTGTPMANSPLDIYGQFRFLDPTIFGTNYTKFLQEYAILGGIEHRFVVGYKNQQDLYAKFKSITYTCKMSDVADALKLPKTLPLVERMVDLPTKDYKVMQRLNKEFIAECENGECIVPSNILTKLLRLQQICNGFCYTTTLDGSNELVELNNSKCNALEDILHDVSLPVVVFCNFIHDIDVIKNTCTKMNITPYELSGRVNDLETWKCASGGKAVLVVQIAAGAEGVDMTNAHTAIYFSLPYSLAKYEQSKARLYRPGQKTPVTFIHLLAANSVDEAIHRALLNKKNVIESIEDGTFDYGVMK